MASTIDNLRELGTLAVIGGGLYLLYKGVSVSAFGQNLVTIGGATGEPSNNPVPSSWDWSITPRTPPNFWNTALFGLTYNPPIPAPPAPSPVIQGPQFTPTPGNLRTFYNGYYWNWSVVNGWVRE